MDTDNNVGNKKIALTRAQRIDELNPSLESTKRLKAVIGTGVFPSDDDLSILYDDLTMKSGLKITDWPYPR